MTATPSRRAPMRSTEPPAETTAPIIHEDISELTGAVRDLATALKPLEALAAHVPTLVEMAQVWKTGKNGGRAVWRIGEVTGAVAKWISAIGVALATIYLIAHAKWELIVKALGA